MKPNIISHNLKYAAALLFFVGILFVGFYGITRADHVNQMKAQGFAYGGIDDSEDTIPDTGIGYLGFGCESDSGNSCENTATSNFPSGYGVRINTDSQSPDYEKFFGYAWSSNYGWVSFYHDDVQACGGGIRLVDAENFIHTPGATQMLKGHARVLNYDPTEWSGCIKFSGQAKDGSNYGVKAESLQGGQVHLSGWAWGENVVGWISFDCKNCKVLFDPVPPDEEECDEADDPEVCDPEEDELTSGLALYVGPSTANPVQIAGNTTYGGLTTDFDEPISVKLVPQAFENPVDTCNASVSSNQGAIVAGWFGSLGSLNPLNPDVLSNQFVSTISNYNIGEIITYTIDCLTVDGDVPVTAEAFVTIQYPQGSVSIDANPAVIDTVLDPNGSTTLSWNFSNVQDDSCSISGFVDFTPADGTDDVLPMTDAFGQTIGFAETDDLNPWSPDSPGSQNLSQIQFPMVFVINCDDFADQELSDSTYITTTEFGCTDSMEAAGWCSNDINPIFEEF